jgi:hypothetical protein
MTIKHSNLDLEVESRTTSDKESSIDADRALESVGGCGNPGCECDGGE